MRSCIRRIFKTATAACWFFQPCSACTRFCKNSLLTAATKGRSCKRLWPKRFRISNLKSSNAPIMQKASRFSHDVGSSIVPSHGLTDADDWPRILKTSHATHWHSCVSRQSELCSERFVINNQLLGQTLSTSCKRAFRDWDIWKFNHLAKYKRSKKHNQGIANNSQTPSKRTSLE